MADVYTYITVRKSFIIFYNDTKIVLIFFITFSTIRIHIKCLRNRLTENSNMLRKRSYRI